MSGLERLRLSAKRSEASSLLAIDAPEVLSSLGGNAAWWTCHDEGDLDAMVSVVIVDHDDEWSVRPISLDRNEEEQTDAEAMARIGDSVFVFGSSFTDKSGDVDRRRAFVARFSESSAIAGSGAVDILDVGSALVDLVATALVGIELLATDGVDGLVNIEGSGFVGDDLVLGLRWPVSADGQPLLVILSDAASVFTAADWSIEALETLEATALVVDVGASPKRPAGVRGLTTVDRSIHLVVGQTERDLAAKKVKAAAARHVQVTRAVDGAVEVSDVEHFEGFRKVEGVAPAPDGAWLYALDDEDAVVLVLSTAD